MTGFNVIATIAVLIVLQLNPSTSFVPHQYKKSLFQSNIERNYRVDNDDDTTSKKLSQKILSKFKLKYNSYKEKRLNNTKYDFPSRLKSPTTLSSRIKNDKKEIHNVHEIRDALFNKGLNLEQIEGVFSPSEQEYERSKILQETLNHEVLQLISYRFKTSSKPGKRHVNDTATLALSIEGGGMRGAVSAGMAAAIGCLGLCDTFDSIYGSSAGSVIGAYMVSRQLCVDVYTDLLVAAKKTFVSKMRIFNSLISSLISSNFILKPSSSSLLSDDQKYENTAQHGMNISFVLDGILCNKTGLRPLDIELFHINDKVQPLHIVSSVVKEDSTTLETICYNSKDGDFSNDTKSIKRNNGDDVDRYGLFACLQASMTVPGAAGPPVQILRSKDNCTAIHNSFDAFCFEPIPYRSAVKDGATHVLVLRSRPDGCLVKTKRGVYEKTIAPLYFKQNALPSAADYFKVGGQQFRYLEDFMTLDEGRCSKDVLIPPTDIIYGAPEETDMKDNTKWKRAHLLPIVVPESKPELPALEQGQDEVLNAVRDGFAAAFDVLAPIVIDDLDALDIVDNTNSSSVGTIGDRVAELIFPRKPIDNVLEDRVHVKGEVIHEDEMGHHRNISNKLQINQVEYKEQSMFINHEKSSSNTCPRRDAHTLLSCLPGLRSGKLSHLADGLHWHIRS